MSRLDHLLPFLGRNLASVTDDHFWQLCAESRDTDEIKGRGMGGH